MKKIHSHQLTLKNIHVWPKKDSYNESEFLNVFWTSSWGSEFLNIFFDFFMGIITS